MLICHGDIVFSNRNLLATKDLISAVFGGQADEISYACAMNACEGGQEWELALHFLKELDRRTDVKKQHKLPQNSHGPNSVGLGVIHATMSYGYDWVSRNPVYQLSDEKQNNHPSTFFWKSMQ